jgi:hypothetical protein
MAKDTTVTLSPSEIAMIEALFPAGPAREAALKQALETKIAQQAVRQAKLKTNREVFSVTVNENGNLVIRGLGNKFPMGIRPDSWDILVANIEAVKAVRATIKPQA